MRCVVVSLCFSQNTHIKLDWTPTRFDLVGKMSFIIFQQTDFSLRKDPSSFTRIATKAFSVKNLATFKFTIFKPEN